MLSLMNKINLFHFVLVGLVAVTVIGCKAGGDSPGLEYAPQMYHSIPYEPLTQIRDEQSGSWLTATENAEVGEFYNSNPNNPHGMTMREPVAGTVKRTNYGWTPYTEAHSAAGSDAHEVATHEGDSVAAEAPDADDIAYKIPYRIPKDSIELAAALLVNPYQANDEVIAQGKVLYERFCDHCHGTKGQGADEGSVGEVYKGVTSYTSAAVKDKPQGHIFHVITHGKGRMQAHGSQISPEDRWRIARYVQQLQQQ